MEQFDVPLENLKVPLVEFAAIWDEAARRCYTMPPTPYVAGVLAACHWVARQTPKSPITRAELVATPETMAEETVAAVKTAYGFADGQTDVNRDWAEGVAATLGWIRGVHRRPPLQLPRTSAA